jgi:hypothetical protein
VLCKHTASAHIPVIAGYYSTIAGVMAGFAFISLFYLVTGYNRKRNDSYRRATIALGAAFVSLLLVDGAARAFPPRVLSSTVRYLVP